MAQPAAVDDLDALLATCRACLKCPADINIFQSKTILDMLLVCAPIEIHVNDGLPNGLCIACINKLRTAFEFKDLCVKSDFHLRKLLMKQEYLCNVTPKREKMQIIEKDIISLSESPNVDNNSDSIKEEVIDDLSEFVLIVGEPEGENKIIMVGDRSDNNDNTEQYNFEVPLDNTLPQDDIKVFRCHLCSDTFTDRSEYEKHQAEHQVDDRTVIIVGDLDEMDSNLKEEVQNYIETARESHDVTMETIEYAEENPEIFTTIEYTDSNTAIADGNVIFEEIINNESGTVLIDGEEYDVYPLNEDETEIDPNNIFSIVTGDPNEMSVATIDGNEMNVDTNEIVIENSEEQEIKIYCNYCGMSMGAKYYKQHLKQKHNGFVYKCDLCYKILRGAWQAERHKSNHREFICDICGKKFFSRGKIVTHLHRTCANAQRNWVKVDKDQYIESYNTVLHMNKDRDNKFKCMYCDRKCTKKVYLLDHIKRKHITDLKIHPCDLCERKFISEHEKNRHEKHHKVGDSFPCPLCKENFEKITDVREHLKTGHMKVDASKITRGQIITNIASITNLDQLDKLSNHGLNVLMGGGTEAWKRKYPAESVPCGYCKEIIASHSSLYKHWKLEHSDVRYNCDVCNKTIIGANTIEMHKKFHIKYPCEFCGVLFTRTNMIPHRMTHLGPVFCSICNKQYSTKKSMVFHMKLVHSDTTPFQCDYCGVQMKFKKQFINHIQMEHLQKGNQCDQCDKSFYSNDQLKKHMLNHTDVKPYTCIICKMQFKYRHAMKYHFKSRHPGLEIKALNNPRTAFSIFKTQ